GTPAPARRESLHVDAASPARSMATLWITAVAAETGVPLAGVRLSAAFEEGSNKVGPLVDALAGELRKEPLTNEEGRARFRLKPGNYFVTASWGPRREAQRCVPVAALAPGERRELRLEP